MYYIIRIYTNSNYYIRSTYSLTLIQKSLLFKNYYYSKITIQNYIIIQYFIHRIEIQLVNLLVFI